LAALIISSGLSRELELGAQPRAAARTPYPDVRHLFAALPPALIPDDLRALPDAERAARWPDWLDARDRAIRERLERGDEDTVLLWMALGTSFTREPRVTDVLAASPDDGAALVQLLQARARDFVIALASSAPLSDRAVFARRLLEARGLGFATDADRTRAGRDIIERFAALLKEQRALADRLRAARAQGDASAVFAARSTIFHDRGLSLDTSLSPNIALADALQAIRARDLLGSGGVRRAAVIGPGLDFADKDSGFDFYPIQTLQPFALYETLLRLGLAEPAALDITAFDLSPRVLQHVTAARERAARGEGYPVVLPMDQRAWTPATLAFWKGFGDRIGRPAAAPSPPPGLSLQVRAAQIDPQVVGRISAIDLNVIVERADAAPFDLIVATNVLVYYDVFEQTLALANIASMLRPGGLLLTNTALLELPGSRIRSAGSSTTAYSDRPGDGDHIVWYRRD
jgi:SAM-dependent methyltransferase